MISNLTMPEAFFFKPQRSNSIDLQELNIDASDGGIERAALATVYGVQEYSESKIFWNTAAFKAADTADTIPTDTAAAVKQHSQNYHGPEVAKDPTTLSTNHGHGQDNASYTRTFSASFATALNNNLKRLHHPSRSDFDSRPQPLSGHPLQIYDSQKNPSLPHIPTVSEFDDLWIETNTIFNANNTSESARKSTGNSKFAENHSLQCLDLSDLPFSIFDLIESDTDSRLILWGLQGTAETAPAPKTPVVSATTTAQHSTKLARLLEGWPQLTKKKSSATLTTKKQQPTTSAAALPIDNGQIQDINGIVIEAATVEKLVEKLTATLDYTFMTDFFLIYRVFMTPLQLCKFLISRFKWSIEENEEKRCVVRIRTFVVLRHWLLNYFLHDFIPRKELRILLTDFLNEMPFHPIIQQSPRDQRIIKGLKRVIRRLKRVYYGSSSVSSGKNTTAEISSSLSTAYKHANQMDARTNTKVPVYIVDPAPPAYEEEVQTIVKKQLSAQYSVSQKAYNFVKRIHVDDRHSKNSAIQQKQLFRKDKEISNRTTATNEVPVVVIGNFYSSPQTFQGRDSTISSKKTVNDLAATLRKQPQPSTQEQHHKNYSKQKRRSSIGSSLKSFIATATSLSQNSACSESLLENQQQQYKKSDWDDNYALEQWQAVQQQYEDGDATQRHENASRTSITDSLESIITPGTSVNDYAVDSNDSESYAESDTVSDTSTNTKQEAYHGNNSDESTAFVNRTATTVNEKDDFFPAVLSEKLENLRQEQNYRRSGDVGSSFTTYNERPSIVKNNNIAGLAHLRTRSFYTAQLAIPSNVATPDLYIPTPPPVQYDDNRPTPEYFDIPINCRNLQHSVGQNSSVAELAKTTPVTSLPNRNAKYHSKSSLCERVDLKKPQDTEQSEAFNINSTSSFANTSKRMSNPLPQGAPSQQTKWGEEEKWRLSMQQNQQGNSDSPLKVYEVMERRARQQWPPFKSRIVELGVGTDSTKSQQSGPSANVCSIEQTPADETSSNNNNRASTITIQPYPRKSILLTYSTTLIAQQLCLIERAILLDIDWEELVDCRWTKMPTTAVPSSLGNEINLHSAIPSTGTFEHTTKTKLIAIAPGSYSRAKRMKQQYEKDSNAPERGIERAITRFNAVCQWVSSEIVQTSRIEDRVKVVEKYIRLAKKCKLFCNFATLIQILLGLQSPPVSRLSKTWALVSHQHMKTLQELSVFTSPTRNWKNIRDSMTLVAEEYGESPTEIQIQMKESGSQYYENSAHGSLNGINNAIKSMTDVLRRKRSSNSSRRKSINKAKVFDRNMTIKLPFGGCIPFLGIYLSDLVFNAELPACLSSPIKEGYNSRITKPDVNTFNNIHTIEHAVFNQPLVHFRKHRITATIIKRVLIFQKLAKRYSFEPYAEDNCVLYDTCVRVKALDMDSIQRLSLTIEP